MTTLSSSISERIIDPALGEDRKFVTYDGKQEFQANITCSSESPVVQVTAFPVGTVSSVGELNIQIEYDTDIDGTFDGSLVVNNVAGMCGNGFVKNCSPSGSWKGCEYCRWEFVDNQLQELCEYGTGADSTVPIGPEGLQGCFCFNASCGSPVMDMMETILSFAAKGVIDLLSEENNLLIITQMDYDSGNLQLGYMGSVVGNCASGMTNDAYVSGLLGLYGQIDFAYDDAVDEAREDPQHPYTILESTFSQGTASTYSCTMTARVASELREMETSALVQFGFGYDADGGSKQCYWAGMNGYWDCRGIVSGQTYSFTECKNAVIPNALHSICVNQTVNSNIFTEVTSVNDYKAVSGIGNYYGCYGADNDSADQYWEVLCWGLSMEDFFVCNSPSMSLPDETIQNSPYSEELFQGCGEILPPISTCTALEEREKLGECELVSEIVDGVYTVRDGTNTGLSPSASCDVFEGTESSITVCEPWWKTERVYRCEDFDATFEQEKERSNYIGNTIGYDADTGIWATQGDVTWDDDGTKIERVIDPNIEFQNEADSCIPACRVEVDAKKTDLFIPTQGKLEADGNYHLPYDGELSYTTNTDTVIQTIRECQEQDDRTWVCPDIVEGERIVSDCTCYDEESFVQVVATLQTINLAATDLICSSGTEQGMCIAEDIGETSTKVMCGDFGTSVDGTVDTQSTTLWECLPKLWKGQSIADQSHILTVNDAYQCTLSLADFPLPVELADEMTALQPEPSWFAEALVWANTTIQAELKSNSNLIPKALDSCVCSDSSKACSWSLAYANKISEEYYLALAPASSLPFGYVDLLYTVYGTWSACEAQSTNYRFRLAMEKGAGGNLVQTLSLIEPFGIYVGETSFTNQELLMKQCLHRYIEPYIDFEDPATKGRFVFSYADEVLYQLAVKRGELPAEASAVSALLSTLPYYPPVYRATYNIDSDGQAVTSTVPNSPMFLESTMTATWTSEGQLGQYEVHFSNLTPYVYYWECPEGEKHSGTSNTCGGVDPTGGVDETINGAWCFQYRCDPTATVEPNTNFSGCGYTNDGTWQ